MVYSLAVPLGDGTAAQDIDATLIAAAQIDRAAFAPLYYRYRDRIYAYLRTRTRTAEDAADLTQQVFVQALAALPRYRPGGAPFAAWLARIAHNLAATYHKRYRQTLTWDCMPEPLQPIASENVETYVLQREERMRLNEVLRTCTASTREVLALHYAARLTVAETAIVVGRSEAAVKKQITRTLHALKEKYNATQS